MILWVMLFGLVHPMGVANAETLRVEDMHLKQDKDSELPIVEVLKRTSSSSSIATAGLLGAIEGYDLSHLQPFTGLFSDEHHIPSDDKTTITDTRTNEVINIPIYRATYDDGSIALAEKDDHGNFVYLELRRPTGKPDVFLIPSAVTHLSDDEKPYEEDSEFLAFTEDDVDYENLQSQFHYADVSTPEDSNRRLRKSKSLDQNPLIPNFDYRHGRDAFMASSSFSVSTFESAGARNCESFRVVNLGIVFDAEFCAMNGSFEASRRRIMTIVASASFHYERDMCVKLRLTDIYTPETSCSRGGNSFFKNYNRFFPCGGNGSFLSRFSTWVERNRRSLGLDNDATIHVFSGFPPPGGTIGCAFVGSLCNNDFTYGIEYMSFARNPHSQGVVLAHEIGHILNAPHLLTNTNSHVMEPNINNAAAGFNILSIHSIMSFLNSDGVTCDGFTANNNFLAPTAPPSTPMPTPLPTPQPSPRPSPRPTPTTTESPVSQPTNNRCSVSQDGIPGPNCIFTSNQGDYACLDASSLLDASATPGCLFPNPITRILRCGGRLRNGRILNRGNSGTPASFRANSCSDSCVVVSNFLCFKVDKQEQVHSISFDAFADFDVFETFQTDVFVRNNDGSDACNVAATSCVS